MCIRDSMTIIPYSFSSHNPLLYYHTTHDVERTSYSLITTSLFIFILCFNLILLRVRTEQCQSMVHSPLSAILLLYLLVFLNDPSFPWCKPIRGKIRESNRQSLLSLLCATVAANKTKRSSICFCWESFNNRWVLNIQLRWTSITRSVLLTD